MAHGDGHPHLAVGVAPGLVDIAAGGKGLGNHLFGSGLAHASSDADDRGLEALPIGLAHPLQGGAAVLYQHQRAACLKGVVSEAGSGSGGKGAGDIGVAVYVFAPDGDKHDAGAGLTAVGDEVSNSGGAVAGEKLAARHFSDFRKG